MKLQSITTFLLATALWAGPIAQAKDKHAHDEKPPTASADPAKGQGDEHHDEVKLSAAAVAQNGIQIGKAEARSLASSFVAPARVSFNTEAMAHVGSVVSGRVVEIRVRVGDRVKKDDVLLVVESPELGRSQSDYLQKRTAAEVAAASIAPAKDSYDRAKKLYDESKGIALAEVQKREVEYRAAVGNKATADGAQQAAENELHLLGVTDEEVKKLVETREIRPRHAIRAAIAGQVIDREVTLGELVSPAKEKLLVIADTSSYWILAEVPEGRLDQVTTGSSAEITLAALANVRIKGEVSLISAEVDPTTRTARVRIVVENGKEQLKPGMFAQAILFGPTEQNVLTVPQDAVQTVEGKPSVFVPVEGEPNTFARREVVVGKAIGGFMHVLSGIKENDAIVVVGTFILKAELGKGEAGHEH